MADDASRLVDALRLACDALDAPAVAALIAGDAFLVEDAGGAVAAEAAPVHGSLDVSRVLLEAIGRRELVGAEVNGTPGLLVRERGRVVAVACITIRDDLVSEMWLTLNPAKLGGWNRERPISSDPSQP